MLLGIHHVTALAGDAQRNLDFYTGVLGLRLVKRTVNYDDPGTHHFYYGDARGSPGSLLTFFPWGHARRPRKGTGQVIAVAYGVGSEARGDGGRTDRLPESDPDGLTLELDALGGTTRLRSVTLSETDAGRALALLEGVLGFARVSQEGNRQRFAVPDGAFIDVLHEPGGEPGKMGAGIVHHLALRVAEEPELMVWRERLIRAGFRVSHVRDRTYFRSIYFRPQGSTLFEIATDGPGFTIDEEEDALGSALCLPAWLEPHRADIAARLTPIEAPRTPMAAR